MIRAMLNIDLTNALKQTRSRSHLGPWLCNAVAIYVAHGRIEYVLTHDSRSPVGTISKVKTNH